MNTHFSRIFSWDLVRLIFQHEQMLLHLNTGAVHITVHTKPCMAPRLLWRNVCASSSEPGKDGITPIPLLIPTPPLGLNPGSKGTDEGTDETSALTLSELGLTQKFQLEKTWSINFVLKGYGYIYIIPYCDWALHSPKARMLPTRIMKEK